MVGNFRLATKFAVGFSQYVYENVFFDRFNSIFKGFYLVISEQQLADTIKNNLVVTFTKIPSTECFGSQDVTLLEFCDPREMTHDRQKMIYFLNSVIKTENYRTVGGY
ncbi:MAG: hypothetical protein FWE84_02400 [Firmicutes bacterium]|nr:hypothetical protein [Bacillota bacterium]